MTPEELQSVIDGIDWDFLGEGGYNHVTVSSQDLTIGGYSGKWVFKKSINDTKLVSKSSRAVRKWNILNPDFPAFETTRGWIAPFLGDSPASDADIANKLIDIYLRTREIIADPYANHNFLVYQGNVICIDVDFSLRRGSFASEDWLNDRTLSNSLVEAYCIKPKSIAIVQTLLYLQKYIPDNAIKNEYINQYLINKLHLFRIKEEPISADLLDTMLGLSNLDVTSGINKDYITPIFFNALHGLRKNTLTNELVQQQLSDPVWVSEMTPAEFLHLAQHVIPKNNPLINKTWKDGYTLLHLAVVCNHIEIVGCLIMNGAELNITTPIAQGKHSNIRYPGMTALDIALSSISRCDIAILLANAGARISPAVSVALPSGDISPIICAKMQLINPLTHFRNELIQLARSSDTLSENRKTELMSLIIQNPHVLNWELDANGMNFLHYVFTLNNERIINELVRHPQWRTISQITNQESDWTLWHIIADAGHGHLNHHLSSININAITKRSQSTALHLAAVRKNDGLCKMLLDNGANPTFKNDKGRTAEVHWLDNQPNNPFKLFYNELYLIAINNNSITRPDTRKAELLALITQHPHFLTCKLNANGMNFLHYAFTTNNIPVINVFFQHRQWIMLSQTTNQDNWTLWHTICNAGHEHLATHLNTININAVAKQSHSTALHFAAMRQNHRLCTILLEQGADPTIKNSSGQTAEQCWPNPQQDNSLTRLRCELQHVNQNTGNLPETRRIGLHALTRRHPHLLTWANNNNAAAQSAITPLRTVAHSSSEAVRRRDLNGQQSVINVSIFQPPRCADESNERRNTKPLKSCCVS